MASLVRGMASLVVEDTTLGAADEKVKSKETKEEELNKDFQTIFDVYHSAKGCEESPFTRLLLSYLENSEDSKTMAAFQTVGTKYKDCLREALVKAKMKMIPEVKEKYKGKDNPPFIQAAKDGNIEHVRILLLEDGMNANQKNKYGQTALHDASYYGHTNVVNLLLQQKNVSINLQSNGGSTALHKASQQGHTDVVNLILQQKNLDINQMNNKGGTALHIASFKGHIDVVNLLVQQKNVIINQKDNYGWSALQLASGAGQTEVVKILLNQTDIQVDIKDKKGETPLAIALINGHTEIIKLLKERKST